MPDQEPERSFPGTVDPEKYRLPLLGRPDWIESVQEQASSPLHIEKPELDYTDRGSWASGARLWLKRAILGDQHHQESMDDFVRGRLSSLAGASDEELLRQVRLVYADRDPAPDWAIDILRRDDQQHDQTSAASEEDTLAKRSEREVPDGPAVRAPSDTRPEFVSTHGSTYTEEGRERKQEIVRAMLEPWIGRDVVLDLTRASSWDEHAESIRTYLAMEPGLDPSRLTVHVDSYYSSHDRAILSAGEERHLEMFSDAFFACLIGEAVPPLVHWWDPTAADGRRWLHDLPKGAHDTSREVGDVTCERCLAELGLQIASLDFDEPFPRRAPEDTAPNERPDAEWDRGPEFAESAYAGSLDELRASYGDAEVTVRPVGKEHAHAEFGVPPAYGPDGKPWRHWRLAGAVWHYASTDNESACGASLEGVTEVDLSTPRPLLQTQRCPVCEAICDDRAPTIADWATRKEMGVPSQWPQIKRLSPEEAGFELTLEDETPEHHAMIVMAPDHPFEPFDVQVDKTLPPGRIEFRDREGTTLGRLDVTVQGQPAERPPQPFECVFCRETHPHVHQQIDFRVQCYHMLSGLEREAVRDVIVCPTHVQYAIQDPDGVCPICSWPNDSCHGSDLYWCPRARQIECPQHGGFDTCCSHPEDHWPLDKIERYLDQVEPTPSEKS